MPTKEFQPPEPTRYFDYHRTVLGFHGTRLETADELVSGKPFDYSRNDDDWLGHGIYFWEYAPRQAWRWADQRHGKRAAVVGAMIRLGKCLDLLDPSNVDILRAADRQVQEDARVAGTAMPENANAKKYRDCAAFNTLHRSVAGVGFTFDSVRAVFVPMKSGGLRRAWPRSGIFDSGHIQLCVRNPSEVLAVWHVKRNGKYGKDQSEI